MAVLQQHSASASSVVYSLNADTTRIGRQPDCEIVLPSQDISRYHPQVCEQQGLNFVENLQSRNGALDNGRILAGPAVLEDGDQITISSVQFSFLIHNPLQYDSSPSGFVPSVITLSQESLSGSPENNPLVVRKGDRIPAEIFGVHQVHSDAIVCRVSVGSAEGGWPTLRKADNKLFRALRMLYRLRGSPLESDVLPSMLDGLFEAFDATERIAVMLRCPAGLVFEVAAASSREADDHRQMSIPLLNTAMESGESLLCVEWEPGPDGTVTPRKGLTIRCFLSWTLVGQDGSPRGAVQIETRQLDGFEQSHAKLLAILSHVISCWLDDAAAANAVTGPELLSRSIEPAEELRRRLVLVKTLQVGGFRVGHRVMAVPDVAADLVDYFRLSDGRLACFILDVPGRGSQAVGLMAPRGTPRDFWIDSEMNLADNDVLLLCPDGIARIPSADGKLITSTEINRVLKRTDLNSRNNLEDRVIHEIRELRSTSQLDGDIIVLAIHKSEAELSDSSVSRIVEARVPR